MKPEKDIFEQWSDELKSKNWFVRKINRILLWWDFEGRYLITNIKLGIKNIIYWLPIIWKDRDYDNSFIYTILQSKLKKQAKYIKDKNFHTCSQRDAEIMFACVNLIDRLKNEYYLNESFNYYDLKTWFEPIKDKPGYSSWEYKITKENFDEFFKKYPLIYRQIKDKDDKYETALNISRINHERAKKLLFKILEQNIERWWN